MKLIRYADGAVRLEEAPVPAAPPGGLLVRTEACGLCSGELMDWYMAAKGNPILGHEVAGIVVESGDARFPAGCRIFPHHHAPCGTCEHCLRGAYVQCAVWRRTRLEPGGMAEYFAVSRENLADTHIVDDLRAVDAALVEPLACVMKSLRQARWRQGVRAAVVGLGNMGLLHMLAIGADAAGCDVSETRLAFARTLGMKVDHLLPEATFDVVFVCPGSIAALELASRLVRSRGTIVRFAPLGSGHLAAPLLDRLYFDDVTLTTSYSAGPDDCIAALEMIRAGAIKAEHIVSDFVRIEELSAYYPRMKAGEILKAMVVFDPTCD